MPWTDALPFPTRSVGSGNPPIDMNAVLEALAAMGAGANVQNPLFGADPTGTLNSTPAFNSAPDGVLQRIPGGVYLLNDASSVALSVAASVLAGDGQGPTVIKIGASFSAAQAFAITAALCGLRDMSIVGANATTTSNPVANGAEVTAAGQASLRDLFFQHVNGYCIESVGGASVNNADAMLSRIIGRNCAGGIHILGVTGTSFIAEHFLDTIQLQQIGTTANLDGVFIQDSQDILTKNLNVGVVAGTGSALHIQGACSSLGFSKVDLGMTTTSAPCLLIEANGNGLPGGLDFDGRVIQNGLNTLKITAGNDITFTGITFKGAQGDTIAITGGVAGTQCDVIRFIGCTFKTGGQAGGTCYDVNLNGVTGGLIEFDHCTFQSPVGSGAGLVTNPVNDPGHRGIFTDCKFVGTGTTPSTVFAAGGTPQIVRNSPGATPRGSITAGTIGASPATVNTSQYDTLISFTAINGMTAFKIGGTAMTVLPAVGSAYTIPARTSLEVDWTTTAPTWQWFA
jgi:hypothetical protein